MKSRYETDTLLDEYLLFHYGSDHDQMPFDFGPSDLNFPVRCVTKCVDFTLLPKNASALDLGCAVGRSSFELSRYCQKVIGIDNSQSFIQVAKQLQEFGQVDYSIYEEPPHIKTCIAHVSKEAHPERVRFFCEDAVHFVKTHHEAHDIVLAANLICRLPNPRSFLENIHRVVTASGQLILISPYSWLEEFTPQSHWLQNGLESLKEILSDHFKLKKAFDLPFLIREHRRKYEWGVSQASIWIKS